MEGGGSGKQVRMKHARSFCLFLITIYKTLDLTAYSDLLVIHPHYW